jgi:hypothetical protein
MPKFKTINYPNEVHELFDFLKNEYNYKIVESGWKTVSYIVKYEKENIKIVLNFDIKDNAFYFYVLKGDEEISFITLFKRFEKISSPKKFIPDESQYLEALKLNAELLKKYGDKILKN